MLPAWTQLLFLFAVLWALTFLRFASRSRLVLIVVLAWGTLHVLLASRGFYLVFDAMPPRLAMLFVPMLLTLLLLAIVPSPRAWMRSLDLRMLTMIHVVRIPVEFVLHEAGHQGLIPVMMTWSGTNWDILSGVSAPFVVAYLSSVQQPSRALLVTWNVACLLLLLNVLVTALLSVPSVIQQLNFDRPNLLVLHAPYILLPSVIVPVVLWAHLAALLRLLAPKAA